MSGEIDGIITVCEGHPYKCDACGKRLRRRRMKNHVYLCGDCYSAGAMHAPFNPLQSWLQARECGWCGQRLVSAIKHGCGATHEDCKPSTERKLWWK